MPERVESMTRLLQTRRVPEEWDMCSPYRIEHLCVWLQMAVFLSTTASCSPIFVTLCSGSGYKEAKLRDYTSLQTDVGMFFEQILKHSDKMNI